ncbi:MAG: trimethylamine methyltransferase family protein [Gammaproteobacteria bacterium]|nr:trimethylamine methyltransferase family protein [Gammaproteobacteria bacterium]
MARRNRRTRRIVNAISQLEWRNVVNAYGPINVLDDEQVQTIIDSALGILETSGMRFLEPGSRARLAGAGVDVDPETLMARFDPAFVMEQVALAPSSFELRARNPHRHLQLGTGHHIFASVGGPAFVSDLDKGRRPGTYAEMCDYLRLIQSLNIIHQEGGGPFEAMDLPADTRHLDLYLAQYRLTDKNCQSYALGGIRAKDSVEMACIALETDRDALLEKPALLAIINTNSPLQLDIPMTEAIDELAAAGQVCCITPFTLAGSMSPATLAGTLVQQTAEVLAVVAYAQLVRPGARVMYGSFASNVDMRSGSPALGTPEYTKSALASGQIARRLGLPFRSSNTTMSNCNDAQAAYESQMSLWGSVMGGAHLINHAAGWLEGGLTASFEKLIIDAEMLQMMAEYLRPIAFSDDELALDAIAEVGPGGHHFGTAHTLQRYESAFYEPILSSRENFESWQEAGSKDAAMRANTIWKQMLKDYVQPPLDAAIDEALVDYVERRKQESR